MSYLNWVQQTMVDVRVAQSPGPLVLSAVPAAAPQSLVGKTLYDAGVLDVEGDYQCDMFCTGWNDMEVILKPTTVTGSYTATLVALLHNGLEHPTQTTTGAALADATAQVLTLTNLRGLDKFRVKFSLGATDVLTFDEDDATPAIASYNGL